MVTSEKLDRKARLRNADGVVGYCWSSEEETLFPVDFGSWSREPIEFDYREVSAGWTDRNGTLLFWGDVVQTRDGPAGHSRFYVLAGSLDKPNLFADLKTGALFDLSSPTAHTIRNSAHKVDQIGDWNLDEHLRDELCRLVPESIALPRWALLGALMSLSAGAAMFSSLQYFFAASVGPVWTTLGALMGMSLYWLFSQRNVAWLSRKHLIQLSWKVGVMLAAVTLSTGFLLLDHAFSLRVAFVYALSGCLLGVTLTTISGDLVSWVRGGYASELPKGAWNRRYPNR
jgi:hypothetical protein